MTRSSSFTAYRLVATSKFSGFFTPLCFVQNDAFFLLSTVYRLLSTAYFLLRFQLLEVRGLDVICFLDERWLDGFEKRRPHAERLVRVELRFDSFVLENCGERFIGECSGIDNSCCDCACLQAFDYIHSLDEFFDAIQPQVPESVTSADDDRRIVVGDSRKTG